MIDPTVAKKAMEKAKELVRTGGEGDFVESAKSEKLPFYVTSVAADLSFPLHILVVEGKTFSIGLRKDTLN